MIENARSSDLVHLPGFAPRQISALVNREIVQEHADSAAALWRMHEHAVEAPLYTLRDLALLDGRIVAHLEGLRHAGSAGRQLARRGLAAEDPGAVFVVAYLAFAASDRQAMGQIVQLATSVRIFENALVAALSWLDLSVIQESLKLLARAESAAYRRVALAVTAAHRVRSGHGFEVSAEDPDPTLRARALRAIGETKCPNLEATLVRGAEASDPLCRFWALWSMSLFGDERAAVEAYKAGSDIPQISRTALEIAIRAGDRRWARERVRSLALDRATLRHAVVAAGAFGDPTAVPWLLEMMKDNEFARVAAEALAMITGVDLEKAEFKANAPEEPLDADDDDRDLRWPLRQNLALWWEGERHRFMEGERYLAGRPIREQELVDVLRNGYQRQRRAAALEMARLRFDGVVFPTSARADWQRSRLGF